MSSDGLLPAQMTLERRGGTAGRRGLRRWPRSLYLALPTALLLFLVSAHALVLAVDPFNLYRWSRTHDIVPATYPVDIGPRFLGRLERGDIDTVVIGGSPGMAFLPSDFSRVWPGTVAANVTYSLPRPIDLEIILSRLTGFSKVRRSLLLIDYPTIASPADSRSSFFPFYLFENYPLGRLKFGDLTSLGFLLKLATGVDVGLPIGSEERFHRRRTELYARALSMEMTREASLDVERFRGRLASNRWITCNEFPILVRGVLPFVRRVSGEGRGVEIVFPPYALNFYQFVLASRWSHFLRVREDGILDASIAIRRCLVEALSGLPGVHFHALDDNFDLVSDLANYYDPGHVYQIDHYRQMLRDIQSGKWLVTRDTFEAYARRLRERVLNYTYKNSAVPREWWDASVGK